MKGSGSFTEQCWVVVGPNGVAYGDDNCRDGQPKLYLTACEANLAAKVFSGERPMRYGQYRRQRAIDEAVRRQGIYTIRMLAWYVDVGPICDRRKRRTIAAYSHTVAAIRAEFASIMAGQT